MSVRSLRRLCVLAVFAAFAAQMALPALHARSVAQSTRVAPVALPPLPATGLAVSRTVPNEAAHDRDTCPVCQSLLHASPAALSPVAVAPPGALEVLHLATAPLPTTSALHTGHPPRGPPPGPLSLPI